MIRWLAVFAIVALALLAGSALAETYPLLGGEELTGEAMGPDSKGVIIKKTDGTLSERIPWTKFSQDGLKKLSATLPKSAQRWIEPLLEEDEPVIQTRPKAAAPQLKFNAPARLERPVKGGGFGALFASPLTLFLFVLLYAANIYAAYEISTFRNFAPAVVCGLSAVAPVIGPIIFLSMKTNLRSTQETGSGQPTPEEQAVYEAVAVDADGAVQGAGPVTNAVVDKAALPPPVVYRRGTTSFNRRFFETKLAGFLRVIPGETEKDMLLYIKSARGEYVGERFSKVQPNELYLQVRKGDTSSDVTIPYSDIFELKIQHKDYA